MTEKVILYTDGGSRGNPGPAGVGVVVMDASGRVLKEAAKPLGVLTNNEAEYQAVIYGLEVLKRFFGKGKIKNLEIEVRLDSELVASQLRGEYQIKEEKLFPLFIKIWNRRVADFPSISFNHISRKQNRAADRLVNEAMDEANYQRGGSLFTSV